MHPTKTGHTVPWYGMACPLEPEIASDKLRVLCGRYRHRHRLMIEKKHLS